MKIFIGQLPSKISEEDLHRAFKKFGHITSLHILEYSEDGKKIRYGLVEMPVLKQASEAINSLNGKKIKGCVLNVHKARVGNYDRRKHGRRGGRRYYDMPEEKNGVKSKDSVDSKDHQ